MAVEWTITIEGRNEFGDVCRKAVRIDKSWERLFDGDLGLSIEDRQDHHDGAAKRGREPRGGDVFPLSSGLPDCHNFRPVKDYTTRQIRTVFGTVEVRNPRWMICRDCYPGMVVAFAPLKHVIRDRALHAFEGVGYSGFGDVTVISDGAEILKRLPRAMPKPTTHIIDLFHIAMNIQPMQQIADP